MNCPFKVLPKPFISFETFRVHKPTAPSPSADILLQGFLVESRIDVPINNDKSSRQSSHKTSHYHHHV